MTKYRILFYLCTFFWKYWRKKYFFGKSYFFHGIKGGGLISTYGANFGIKSLVSASVFIHRVGAVNFQNFHILANYHSPLSMHLKLPIWHGPNVWGKFYRRYWLGHCYLIKGLFLIMPSLETIRAKEITFFLNET